MKYPKEFEKYWKQAAPGSGMGFEYDHETCEYIKRWTYNGWKAGRRLEKRDHDIYAMRVYIGRELNERIAYSLNKLIGLTLAKVLPELKEEIDEAVAEILNGTKP